MNETLTTIYGRRAVRNYKAIPVPVSAIEQILDAGRMAPSAINQQPWMFYVLTNPPQIKAIGREIAAVAEEHFHLSHGVHLAQTEDAIFHGAPLIIFLAAPRDNEWAGLDIGMCAENMMLAAKSIGLESCPVGLGKFVENTKSFSILNVPSSHRILISLVFGYGDEKTESKKERRKDNVIYIR